jgi:hypothetical protein
VIEANNSVHENVQTTITLISEEKTVNKVEEEEEQIEPPSTPKLFNGKEVSSETHSFVTIPLETQHEPQASPFQRLKEPSYVEIFKESFIERCKYRNRHHKKIFRSKQIGYIRWRCILLEGYQILKKKGWKRLVGHSCDQGKCDNFYFLFFALYF